MTRYLSVKESAAKAQVDPNTVRRWLDNPDVPLTKYKTLNGRVQIESSELDAWLAERMRPRAVQVPTSSPAVTGIAS